MAASLEGAPLNQAGCSPGLPSALPRMMLTLNSESALPRPAPAPPDAPASEAAKWESGAQGLRPGPKGLTLALPLHPKKNWQFGF